MKKGLLVFGLLLSPICTIFSCNKTPGGNDVTHNVTFYAERGYFNDETNKTLVVKVNDGDTVDRPFDPMVSDEEYKFEAWYKDSGLTDSFDFATPITADINLYAKYNFAGEEPFYFQISSEGDIGRSTASISFSTYDGENNLLNFNDIYYYVGTTYEFAEWLTYRESKEISFMEGQKLYIKADERSWQYAKISYKNDDNLGYNIGGNIMSLLFQDDYRSRKDFQGQLNVFNGLFYNDDYGQTNGKQLKDASNLKLPATLLTYGCYENMFAGSGITHAPRPLGESEPVRVGERSCYQMFCECENLGPTLGKFLNNVRSVGDYAFYCMFKLCKKLTSIEGLTIGTEDTQLGEYSCSQMFYLTVKEIDDIGKLLPSTKLAKRCYDGMFTNCEITSISGQLPAAALAEHCYHSMFRGALIEEIENIQNLLPATTLTEGCYCDMFANCMSLVKVTGYLPATTLAKDCYNGMFFVCSALEEAPYFPYEFDPLKKEEWKSWEQCYWFLFAQDIKLKTIKVGFAEFPYTDNPEIEVHYNYTGVWLEGSQDVNYPKTFYWRGSLDKADIPFRQLSPGTHFSATLPLTEDGEDVWTIKSLDVQI